jgi:two-component system response regulator FixJ
MTADARPTVFVVDDDEDVRDSLRALLESADWPVEDFPSAADFLNRADSARGGCLVTDVRMPGMDGLGLQAALAGRGAGLPVIVVTGHGDVPLAVQAMKAGAVDFLEKPFDDEQLLASVARAVALRAQDQGRQAAAAAIRARLDALSPRERQVLDLLVQGKPNKVIGFELDISPRTVEIHRAHLMEKMAARSLSDLVRAAIAADVP